MAEQTPSIRQLVERWLERTPFLQTSDLDFWDSYRSAVRTTLNFDREYVLAAARKRRDAAGPSAGMPGDAPAAVPCPVQPTAEELAGAHGFDADPECVSALKDVNEREAHFEGLLDVGKCALPAPPPHPASSPRLLTRLLARYEELRAAGSFYFSHKAMQVPSHLARPPCLPASLPPSPCLRASLPRP